MKKTYYNTFVYIFLSIFCINAQASNLLESETGNQNYQRITVANYLSSRLKSLGVKRIFAVAGNYVAPFLDTVSEDKSPDAITITGTANEIIAGYAADGYARAQGHKGIGVVAVTYGVGDHSLLNAVKGSFVEQIPIIVINGAPTNKEFKNLFHTELVYTHMDLTSISNTEIYKNATVSAQRITNANAAPFQIDTALTQCLTMQRPIYLEILEDVWRAECCIPTKIASINDVTKIVTKEDTDEAVDRTLNLINKYKNKGKASPMFWIGAEVKRFGLQSTLKKLLEISRYDYTTSILGKSVLSEDTKGFSKVGFPTNASIVIGLGGWTTSKDVGNNNLTNEFKTIIAADGGVHVGRRFYPNVPLSSFMEKLGNKLLSNSEYLSEDKNSWAEPTFLINSRVRNYAHAPEINYDRFFSILNDKLVKDSTNNTIVVDSSFSLIAAQDGLHIKEPNGFIAQGSWLSIGYASPAAIGVKSAIDDYHLGSKRVIVIAGDGAFQQSCQALSSYAQLKHNTVVFVLANGIYGIEQEIVNPNPFRSIPLSGSNKDIYSYNELHSWKYHKLAKVFGLDKGLHVTTSSELKKIIKEIKADENRSYIVNVQIPKLSIPSALRNNIDQPGEDEVGNSNWPDKTVF